MKICIPTETGEGKTLTPHENVAYSVAFRVLLDVSRTLKSEAISMVERMMLSKYAEAFCTRPTNAGGSASLPSTHSIEM